MALSHAVYPRNPLALAEALQNRSRDTPELSQVSLRSRLEGAIPKISFFRNGDKKIGLSQTVSESEKRQERSGKQKMHVLEVNSAMMQAVPLPMKSVEEKNMWAGCEKLFQWNTKQHNGISCYTNVRIRLSYEPNTYIMYAYQCTHSQGLHYLKMQLSQALNMSESVSLWTDSHNSLWWIMNCLLLYMSLWTHGRNHCYDTECSSWDGPHRMKGTCMCSFHNPVVDEHALIVFNRNDRLYSSLPPQKHATSWRHLVIRRRLSKHELVSLS